MNVLVPAINGLYRNVTTVCRSLGKKGHKVHVLSSIHRLKSIQKFLKSKYCSAYDFWPNPMNHPSQAIDRVINYSKENNIDVILANMDSVASLLAYHQDKLPVKVPLPGYSIFKRGINKLENIKAAKKIGVPVPETIKGRSLNHIFKKIEEKSLSYPLVLKPKIRGDGLFGTQVVSSKEELIKRYNEFRKIGKKEPLYNYQKPLVQKFVKGEIYDCCTLNKDGEMRVALTQCRNQTANSFGGGGVVNTTTKTPEIIELSRKLIKELGWTGPAQVEWIKDKEGDFKLLEFNSRIWGTLELSVDAGIDFPALTLEMLKDEEIPKNLDYQVGLKKRWLFPEEFLSVIRDKNPCKRMLGFLDPRDWFDPKVHSHFHKEDLKPDIYNLFFFPIERVLAKLEG